MMKQFIIRLLFAFVLFGVPAGVYAQVPQDATLEEVNAILTFDNITAGTQGGEYRAEGVFMNDYSSYPTQFTEADVTVGMHLFDSKSDRYEIVWVGTVNFQLAIEMNRLNIADTNGPNAGSNAYLYDPTPNLSLVTVPVNAPEKIKAHANAMNLYIIDRMVQDAGLPQVLSYDPNTNVVTLEDGGTVDLSDLNNPGTDDQQISYDPVTGIVTLEDGGTIDLSALSADNFVNKVTFDPVTSVLTLEMIDGTFPTVNLSALDNSGTDDQAISYDAATQTITLEDGGSIDLSGLNDSGSDDQQLTISGNTITLEDGGSVDLAAFLDNTDDQQVSGSFDVPTSTLTVVLEDGGTAVIDLSALNDAGTDDQVLSYDPATQTVTLEGGGTIDLSGLNDAGTDDQQLTISGTVVTLEDGGSVDFASFLDNTDDQQITGSFDAATSTITVALEDGGTAVIDLTALNDAGSDDQALTYDPATQTLTLEDGGVVDLSALNNAGSDDQQLTISGNTVTLEDGGSVDLSGFLDNTDDQQLTGSFDDVTNTLTVVLEDGGTAVIDLSILDNQGTDDQALSYDPATNVITLEGGGTVDLSALNDAGSDDQQLTISGNTVTLEDGGSVDLTPFLDNTDDQAISASFDAVSSVLTVGLEDGGSVLVDLSVLNNTGTDDQAISYDPATQIVTLEDGGTIDLSGLDNTGTDDQQLSYDPATQIVSLEDGGTVDLSALTADNFVSKVTFDPLTNILTLEMVDATFRTVDLSALDVADTNIYTRDGVAKSQLRVTVNDDMRFGDTDGETFVFVDTQNDNIQLSNVGTTTIGDPDTSTGEYAQVEANANGGIASMTASKDVVFTAGGIYTHTYAEQGYSVGSPVTALPVGNGAIAGAEILYQRIVGGQVYTSMYRYTGDEWIPVSGVGQPQFSNMVDARAELAVGEWFAASAVNEFGFPYLQPIQVN